MVPHCTPHVSEQPHDAPMQQHDVPETIPQPSPPPDDVVHLDPKPIAPEAHPNPSLVLKFRRGQHDPDDWELVRPAVPPPPQQLSPIASHHVQYQYPSTQFVNYQYPVLNSPQASGIQQQQEHRPIIPTYFPSPYQTFYPFFPINGQQNMHTMMTTYPQGYSSYSTNQ